MAKRSTATKEKLKEALITLLFQESFEHITIRQLCQQAQINRGTFYLHYLDKYDMVEQLLEDITRKHRMIFQDKSSPQEKIIAHLYFLEENRRLIQAASKSNYIDFKREIRRFLTTMILDEDYRKEPLFLLKNSYQIPQKYALEVFLSSIEGIISHWLAEENPETPEEIAHIIWKLFG